MARIDDRNVKAAPFIYADTETYSLRSDGEHGRIMTDEDDPSSGRDGRFENADYVWN